MEPMICRPSLLSVLYWGLLSCPRWQGLMFACPAIRYSLNAFRRPEGDHRHADESSAQREACSDSDGVVKCRRLASVRVAMVTVHPDWLTGARCGYYRRANRSPTCTTAQLTDGPSSAAASGECSREKNAADARRESRAGHQSLRW